MVNSTHTEYFVNHVKNAIEEQFNNLAQRIHEDIVSKYTEEFNQRMTTARKSAVINAARFFEVAERSDNITINFKMDQLNGKR